MSVLDKALSYAADLSFAVFPVHGIYPDGSCTCCVPTCANPGKHPATRNGLKDASTDPNKIQNMFTSSRPYNIGVATGAVSNIFAVDVDGMEGEASLAALAASVTGAALSPAPTPKTLTNLTGRGRHLIFRHPGQKIKTRANLGHKLDIRGDGGYIIIPPSLHKSGVYYEWDASAGWDIAQPPAWLLDLVLAPPAPSAPVLLDIPYTENEWSSDDVASMLSYISPDISYDEWVTIGMAIHAGGFPFQLWNNWSAGGSKYKGVKDLESHWRSFNPARGITMGTLVSFAITQGWKPEPDTTLIDIGRMAAANIFTSHAFTSQKLQTISSANAPLTIDFNNIPGVIGDTVKWVLSNANLPQPELALLNTIAALGAIFGRRYRSPMDTRTNIYMVGLAGTGSGKGHSKKLIKALMLEAGLINYLGGEAIISGAGLLSDVFKQPSQVMHLDEFGMMLEAIMNKRGASHLTIASKILTELYSNSAEKYIGGQYADKKQERTIISSPNLCIFGISTLEKYTSALNREAIASGELNRFVVYRVSQDRPTRKRNVMFEPPPEWLIKAWKAFNGTAPNHAMLDPDPMLVPWPGLQDRIDDMADFEDEMIYLNQFGAGALWGRYRENAIKIAMIFAIARNHIQPAITSADLDYAEAIVRQSVNFMVNMVNEHLADSQHEKDCNDILNIIRSNNNSISKTALSLATRRMDTKQRDNAIMSLAVQGLISIDKIQPEHASRPSTFYSLVIYTQ